MRAVVVYYSYSGNTKKVANFLADFLKLKSKVNTIQLQPEDESNSFFMQASRAFFHKRAKIASTEFNLCAYDLICFGTPVWAFGPVPAMNTYLDKCVGIESKRILLFTTFGSGVGAGRCFKYMRQVLAKKGATHFQQFSIQQEQVENTEVVNAALRQSLKNYLQ